MSPSDRVIPLLSRVKESGRHEWVACCPAHDDKSPSMAVRETDDGRLLMHCFAGCATSDILAAIGVKFSDLFAEPLDQRKAPLRHPFSPGAVLRAIASEALLVAICGEDAAAGKLSDVDRERLWKAVTRIREAVNYA